ncbi:olfactory receptor 11L1-like [Ascaphus truei]|uniref:olfactory receptor 11L1-like n=1 Tax=Ascaphus truei TaxID=8439 RepID=UPI003F598ECE
MYADNETEVTAFLLLGFNSLQNIKFLLFCLSLTIYIVTISGNVLIISLVSTSHHLHSPMYFFLSHLSLSDLLLTTNVVPNMLHVIIGNGSTISVNGCISQLYFFGVSTVIECFLLTVMSYDRYLAICNPLRYTSIMDLKLQLHLVIWPWLLGFLISLITVITVRSLKFCGPNVINHFFCDLAPLLKLSCSDTTTVEIELLVLSIPIIPLPFVFILGTYVCIFLTIIKIPSSIGRQKAFSTCSSHLIVVGTYYGTLITLYVVPSDGHLSNINKMLSLLYTVVTPLCNPIIYSLRNQELRKSKHLQKHLQKINNS